MSLTGAFVIAAICLARLPLKKAPKIISYCLWAVAGFRLVFPFSIESVFSLIPFKAQTIPPDIAMQSVPHIDSGMTIVDNFISSSLPAPEAIASVNPLQIWTAIGSFIWLFGVAIMIIYGVVSFIILKQKMRYAAHLEANIYEKENIKSPFVLGVFTPKIYVPIGLSEKEQGYIILHEKTHIRRHDHIVKFVAYFILCLHWFNPVVWVAFLLMGTDMEMSCDECVLKEIGSQAKKNYSLSLLTLATDIRIINGSPLAFGEGSVKGRIKNVLNFKKPSRIITIAAIVLVAVLSVGFALNRTDTQKALEKAPSLDVILIANNSTKQQVKAIQLTTSWLFIDKNGIGKGYSSDSAHPLQMSPNDFKEATLSLDNTSKKIEMLFSDNYPPESVSVQRWPAEYATGNHDIADIVNKGEPAQVNGNKIDISNDGHDYIYEVYAKWEQGSSYYTFCVSILKTINQYLDIIMSSPKVSSRTGDYIQEHRQEYDKILAMGYKAMPTLNKILKSGNMGLRGNIASLLSKEILSVPPTDDKWQQTYKEGLIILNKWQVDMGYAIMPEFSEDEVIAAKQIVEDYFKDDLSKTQNVRRTLLDIRYDPQDNYRRTYRPYEFPPERIIVFKVDFNIEYLDGNIGAWNEGIYKDWSMILVRNNPSSAWKLYDQGY
ncbi:MAG: DUF4829 domain-containing protein [Oscillospiraceae bacterium]|nr:DUF4829 domain-containing protein [Oscillospiraceae bacterium]